MNLRPGRVVCCSIKDLTSDQLAVTKETGIPFHELSKDDLATYFPKLRTVVDNKAEVIGNCNSFEGSLPAHLQTTLLRRGKPQSLYEYEYETGENMFVSYSSFGPSAKSLVRMKRGPELEPPPLGTINVVVQVEVRFLFLICEYVLLYFFLTLLFLIGVDRLADRLFHTQWILVETGQCTITKYSWC